MDSTKLHQELIDCFGNVISDPGLLRECENLCQMFNLSASDLFYKWEAFNYNNRSTPFSDLTVDSVRALQVQLQRNLALKNSSKPRTQYKSFGTPGRGLGALINAQAAADNRSLSGPSTISFKGPKNDNARSKKRAYRYMFERISERSEALDNRIDEMAEIVRDHYKITEFGDPASFSQDSITTVGRITSDCESSMKLNEDSLFLESSRVIGSGIRVPLRFAPQVKIRGGPKGAGGIGIFPGAIVALRGKNGGGGWFLASEVLTLPLPRSSPTGRVRLENNTSFSMCIASGPFTSGTDSKYKSWHNLMQSIMSATPNVVLLLGSFVDCNNTELKHGDLDQSAGSLFQEHFTENLRGFLDVSPSSVVLLVPNVQDMISDHAVFPQCELGEEFSSDPRIHLLPNPCQFSINGVTFAVTSIDVLFHLRKEEFFQTGQEIESIADDFGNDVMANLCRHLLEQRSFYPLFPVPDDLSHDVNLDMSHSEALKLSVDDDCAPDVLIVPSKLKHFSKTVHNTVAINPSSVAKGTYSTLQFDGQGTGLLKDQLRVEIVKQGEVSTLTP